MRRGDIINTKQVQAVSQKDWDGLKYWKKKAVGWNYGAKCKVLSFQDE